MFLIVWLEKQPADCNSIIKKSLDTFVENII